MPGRGAALPKPTREGTALKPLGSAPRLFFHFTFKGDLGFFKWKSHTRELWLTLECGRSPSGLLDVLEHSGNAPDSELPPCPGSAQHTATAPGCAHPARDPRPPPRSTDLSFTVCPLSTRGDLPPRGCVQRHSDRLS